MRRFVYIGKNHRFTAFLDSKIHTRLAIVTANELGFAFPPRNLLKKFRPDPSTFYLVIVVTDKRTNRQTYAGDSIIPRKSFRGDNWSLWRMASATPDLRLSSQPLGIAPFLTDRYQFTLLGDRGTRAWTTCPRLLPENATAGSRTGDFCVAIPTL